MLRFFLLQAKERERKRNLVQHNNNLLEKTGTLSLSDVADFSGIGKDSAEKRTHHTLFFL